MTRTKKRAAPGGATLLAKPRAALGSLSSVALSSAWVKAILVSHTISTLSMSNLAVAAVQFHRRYCLTPPPRGV